MGPRLPARPLHAGWVGVAATAHGRAAPRPGPRRQGAARLRPRPSTASPWRRQLARLVERAAAAANFAEGRPSADGSAASCQLLHQCHCEFVSKQVPRSASYSAPWCCAGAIAGQTEPSAWGLPDTLLIASNCIWESQRIASKEAAGTFARLGRDRSAAASLHLGALLEIVGISWVRCSRLASRQACEGLALGLPAACVAAAVLPIQAPCRQDTACRTALCPGTFWDSRRRRQLPPPPTQTLLLPHTPPLACSPSPCHPRYTPARHGLLAAVLPGRCEGCAQGRLLPDRPWRPGLPAGRREGAAAAGRHRRRPKRCLVCLGHVVSARGAQEEGLLGPVVLSARWQLLRCPHWCYLTYARNAPMHTPPRRRSVAGGLLLVLGAAAATASWCSLTAPLHCVSPGWAGESVQVAAASRRCLQHLRPAS